LGEEEENDKLTIRAKELLIRPSSAYNTVPLTIQGSSNFSHFYFGPNEDTYIRGGKSSSNLILGDGGGRTGINVYPQRAMLEQNGSVGATSAIFGGDGSGISLQKNWPGIGFNSYLDAAGHKSISAGYGAQMGLNQINGSLYLVSFPFNALTNTTFASFVQRFYISRFGKIGLGTDNPYADIEIVQRPITFANEDVDIGITYTGGNSPNNASWNTHIGLGSDGGSFASLDNYSFWHKDNAINSGNWYFTASIGYNGYYFQLSDVKLKKDITYLDKSSLFKIMMLKPASFRYKTNQDNEPLSYGFIAQDVEKVFPEMVMTGKTNKLMSYSSLIPILTKGIQEQQLQIETLQKENAELKARLEKLEKIILKQ
jgi:hypothetical protein